MLKPPSAIRAESIGAHSRFSRQFCDHCGSDELHLSCVCVQCKRGRIPVTADPVTTYKPLRKRKQFNP